MWLRMKYVLFSNVTWPSLHKYPNPEKLFGLAIRRYWPFFGGLSFSISIIYLLICVSIVRYASERVEPLLRYQNQDLLHIMLPRGRLPIYLS
jgi:hypothetical protein